MKAGWQTKPLSEVCTLQRGFHLPTHDRKNGRFPLVSSSGISDTRDEGPIASPGVVTGRSGRIGNVFYVEDAFWPLNTTLYVRDFHGNLPRFVYHLLVAFDLKKYSGGTGVPTLNRNDVHGVQVTVPNELAEQQRFVTLLDEAFAGIATAKANAEKNLQNARAIFESHLQSVFEAHGAGWKFNSFEDTVDSSFTLSYGIVQPGDEYTGGMPIVRPTDLGGKTIEVQGLKRIDPALAASYRRTTLRAGDLLLCVRGTTGQISIASKELAGANVTRGIVPIFFEPSLMAQDFGYDLMCSGFVQSQIQEKTYGTALQQINIGDLRKLKLPIPPLA